MAYPFDNQPSLQDQYYAQQLAAKQLQDEMDAKDPWKNWVKNFDPSKRPEYSSLVDENGKVKDPFRVQMATNIDQNPWAKLMLEKQGIEQGQMMDNAAARSNAGVSSAFSNLATRGGLRAGAAERIATKGARDLAFTRNDVQRQGAADRFGILSTATDKQTALDTTNAQTAIADNAAKQKAQMDAYLAQMQGAAADRTATATENAGKKK